MTTTHPTLTDAIQAARQEPGRKFEADGRVVWTNPRGMVVTARRGNGGKLFDVKVESQN
jgi:hypothetical protein